MSYQHKQTGKLYLLLLASAFMLLALAWLRRAPGVLPLVVPPVFLILVLLAYCFQSLLVRDEGDCLALRYGPIPLFRKRFPYSKMTAVEASRSTLLDGWGIHYIPGRGWTYNLWGFTCVKVRMGKKTVRMGTDDVRGLVRFLRGKIGEWSGEAETGQESDLTSDLT